MEAVLSPEQEQLLKQARTTLGELRDALADAGAPGDARTALSDSIRQLDELFLLVVAGEFNSGKSAFINALLGAELLAWRRPEPGEISLAPCARWVIRGTVLVELTEFD